MEMLSKKVPNCAKRQPAENPSAGCLTVCCCFLSASPDPVELASPFPQALVQPGAQGCHALLCPGEGLRLNVLGLFKADVLIDPGLDGAIVHLSRPLEAVAEGKGERWHGLADYLWNYPRVMCIFWFVFALTIAGIKVCRRETEAA